MICNTATLNTLLQETARNAHLYVPAIVDGTSRFVEYDIDVADAGVAEGAGAAVNRAAGTPGMSTEMVAPNTPDATGAGAGDRIPAFDLQNTKIPPKELLFPATEKLYSWGSVEGHTFIESANQETEPWVLFGVRPCDVAAINRLDEVFLTKGYVDEFYQSKREALTIVAIACNRVGDTCFCASMGSDPNVAPDADVLLQEGTNNGQPVFEICAQTAKGEALVAQWAACTQEGSAEREQTVCTLNVNMDGVPEKLNTLFNDSLWDEVSMACLTCGSCTFICPTCHCFDLSQARKKGEDARFRCWDSCMFKDYTLMAGNHNPRDDKRSRVRQRFMHKLCYFEERYGNALCVGCGRCLIDCPASIDITAIIDCVQDRISEDGQLSAAPQTPLSESAVGESAAELFEVVAAERKE